MGRAFLYVILGGGVAAGYAALEFTKRGVSPGELCIISEESVAPYERPALSKGYLLPEDPARLPSFHTCIGAHEERLTTKWYKEHVPRLFTPKIANYYEEYYEAKGVKFIKGTVLNSLDVNTDGKVTAVNLKDGTKIPTDMVVAGIGIRPNTSLFEGQLSLEKGGIKVNRHMQTSHASVYAVGDVAAFPVKLFGETRRLEHVDSARKSAMHVVASIMEPEKTDDFDYLPFFYSRVFALSWQFYGDNAGEAVHFGDYSGKSFGAYWVNNGHLVGSFLEGGTKEEYKALANATRLKPPVENLAELERQGLSFALDINQTPPPPALPPVEVSPSGLAMEKPLYAWHATAGVILAASIAAFAYWYGRRRRRW
ncbi:Monodehydroascorbate reductase 4, peroxisomal, variant 2 [Ancistrocladus abbreviatus]